MYSVHPVSSDPAGRPTDQSEGGGGGFTEGRMAGISPVHADLGM